MIQFSGVPLKEWQPQRMGDVRVDGMRAAVVGGTGGLRRAVALWLAAHGAEVTVVGQIFRDAGVARLSFIKVDHQPDGGGTARCLPGLFVLVPAITTTGGSGFALAKSRQGRLVDTKKEECRSLRQTVCWSWFPLQSCSITGLLQALSTHPSIWFKVSSCWPEP